MSIVRRISTAAAVAVLLTGVLQLSVIRPTNPSEALTGSGSVTQVQVTGRAGVGSGASAVVLNLTATDATAAGYVTAYPCGSARPNVSNLNFTGSGIAIANSATVPVGAGGKVCLFTSASTNLIADINGWYPANSDFTPTTPSRLLDTRPGRAGSGSVTQVQVTGRAGVGSGASAVVLNLTATDATAAGYVTAYPCGSARPNVSNLNFTGSGIAIANSATVPVGAGGKVCLFTSASTNLIADINGWYPANSDFTPTTPSRLLDTRPGRAGSGSVTQVQVTGRAGVGSGASAVVLNLTATDATAAGYVTAYPCGSARPNVSNLNFTGSGIAIANSATVPVGAGGKVCLFTSASTNLIADINGWYPANSDFTPTTPSRLLDTRPAPGAPTPPASLPPASLPPGNAQFVATFDTPSDFYDRFDTYTGNYCDFGTSCRPENDPNGGIRQFSGSHSMACEGPDTKRTVDVSNHRNFFWHCAPKGPASGHVMTGMNTAGYAIASFSPKQVFANVRQVCWDMSLADLGGGKWANVVLVPEATLKSHPNTNPRRSQDGEGAYRLDYVTPDFTAPNGPGFFNIQDLGSGSGAVVGVKEFGGSVQIYRGTSVLQQRYDSWNAGSDEATRFQHCFRDNGNDTITFTQQRSSGLYTVTTAGSFPDGPVRVLFQDDSYNPDKHDGTGRYTWHWDNILVY